MPRKPNLMPAGIRISDKITLGHFHKCFPKHVVERCLEDTDRASQRRRELPNDVVVYYAMMLAIYREASQTEVLSCIAEGLQWLYGFNEFKITGKSGISQARSRVGWEPLKRVFDECAKPLAAPNSPGCFYRDWRLVAVDGTTLNVDDCAENAQYFGRPSNQKSDGAYPQARLVGLVECGSHAIWSLAVGKFTDSELALAPDVLSRLAPGMLCLADRLFMSFDIFCQAKDTGADLLFRARLDRQLPAEQVLSDGTYLSSIYASGDRKRTKPVQVRVIEYSVNGSSGPETYRLITTILDPAKAPAEDLARLYRERWEFENALDELKVHLNDGAAILRSRTPQLAIQEIYGLVMAHYAIRAIMYDAAASRDLDPDKLSFTGSLRVIRRKLPSFGAFSPSSASSEDSRRDSADDCFVQQRAIEPAHR
jgi:Insertion element 4 transposase N-terminal/Transposase DDE domain